MWLAIRFLIGCCAEGGGLDTVNVRDAGLGRRNDGWVFADGDGASLSIVVGARVAP